MERYSIATFTSAWTRYYAASVKGSWIPNLGTWLNGQWKPSGVFLADGSILNPCQLFLLVNERTRDVATIVTIAYKTAAITSWVQEIKNGSVQQFPVFTHSQNKTTTITIPAYTDSETIYPLPDNNVYEITTVTITGGAGRNQEKFSILALASPSPRILYGLGANDLMQNLLRVKRGIFPQPEFCMTCMGTGLYKGATCPECDGYKFAGLNATYPLLDFHGRNAGKARYNGETDEVYGRRIWAYRWNVIPTKTEIERYFTHFMHITNPDDLLVWDIPDDDEPVFWVAAYYAGLGSRALWQQELPGGGALSDENFLEWVITLLYEGDVLTENEYTTEKSAYLYKQKPLSEGDQFSIQVYWPTSSPIIFGIMICELGEGMGSTSIYITLNDPFGKGLAIHAGIPAPATFVKLLDKAADGHTYDFTITVHPDTQTWDVVVDDVETLGLGYYQPGPLNYINLTRAGNSGCPVSWLNPRYTSQSENHEDYDGLVERSCPAGVNGYFAWLFPGMEIGGDELSITDGSSSQQWDTKGDLYGNLWQGSEWLEALWDEFDDWSSENLLDDFDGYEPASIPPQAPALWELVSGLFTCVNDPHGYDGFDIYGEGVDVKNTVYWNNWDAGCSGHGGAHVVYTFKQASGKLAFIKSVAEAPVSEPYYTWATQCVAAGWFSLVLNFASLPTGDNFYFGWKNNVGNWLTLIRIATNGQFAMRDNDHYDTIDTLTISTDYDIIFTIIDDTHYDVTINGTLYNHAGAHYHNNALTSGYPTYLFMSYFAACAATLFSFTVDDLKQSWQSAGPDAENHLGELTGETRGTFPVASGTSFNGYKTTFITTVPSGGTYPLEIRLSENGFTTSANSRVRVVFKDSDNLVYVDVGVTLISTGLSWTPGTEEKWAISIVSSTQIRVGKYTDHWTWSAKLGCKNTWTAGVKYFIAVTDNAAAPPRLDDITFCW